MYPNTMEDRPYRKAAPKPSLLHRLRVMFSFLF